MAGMIKSIFGLTTEDVREQQLKQQQTAAQQYAQQTNANQGVASFGTAVGAGLGRGLMSGLGFEDPDMAKAQEVEARQTALNEQLAALDPNDPRRQYLLAEALSSMGDTQASLAAYASGRQMEQYQSQLAEQDRQFGLRKDEQEGVAQRARANVMAKFLEASFSPEDAAKLTAQAFGEEVPEKTTDTPGPSKLKDDKTTPTPTPTPKPKLKEMQIGDMMGSGSNRTIMVGENDFRPVTDFTTEQLQAIRAAKVREAGKKSNAAALKAIGELPAKIGELPVKAGGNYLDFLLDPQNTRGQ